MKEIAKKLIEARKEIAQSKTKKGGKNAFAKYDYFTPEQVDGIVTQACVSQNILPLFSLERNELGLVGQIKLIDCDSGEELITTMATDIPIISATNITQQYGGCETYTKRYMLMSLFGISDNKLDFDSKDNKGDVLKLIKGAKSVDDLQEIKNAYPNQFITELKARFNELSK